VKNTSRMLSEPYTLWYAAQSEMSGIVAGILCPSVGEHGKAAPSCEASATAPTNSSASRARCSRLLFALTFIALRMAECVSSSCGKWHKLHSTPMRQPRRDRWNLHGVQVPAWWQAEPMLRIGSAALGGAGGGGGGQVSACSSVSEAQNSSIVHRSS